MERISNDSTMLATQNLTIELIKQGECLEFDAEKKLNKRSQYTLLEPVMKVIEMYTKDLQTAYLTIEEMEQELAENQKALEEVTAAATKSAEQVRKVLAGERRFGDAETKLAELMASVEELKRSHEDDGETIAKLKEQIQEAQALAESVPELAEDVQYVLDAVQKSVLDAGLDLDEILSGLDG